MSRSIGTLQAARGEEVRSRVILDVERVPEPGQEAAVAMACFIRLAPFVPGVQGVVYDTALRGVHHQVLLRELGLLPVNRVTAAEKGANAPDHQRWPGPIAQGIEPSSDARFHAARRWS